jgi:hypothetical protein
MGVMPGLRHHAVLLLKRFAANKRGNDAKNFPIGLPARV